MRGIFRNNGLCNVVPVGTVVRAVNALWTDFKNPFNRITGLNEQKNGNVPEFEKRIVPLAENGKNPFHYDHGYAFAARQIFETSAAMQEE